MICTWAYKDHVFEFDAFSQVEEVKKVRAWAKERGWKFKDMVKEQ